MDYRMLAMILSFAALVLTRPVAGAELPQAKPAAVGMSTEKLALVTPAMQKLVDAGKVAGAITVVARQGQVVYREAVGKQDLAAATPMREDAIVRIYSMSKPITAVAAMMLVEEGKLALDDPIAKHLREFKDVQVFAGEKDGELQLEKPTRAPTIRDLMRHTSGLTYGFLGDNPVDEQYRKAEVLNADGTLADMVTKLGKLPLVYQPGTRFNYSVSIDVLGRVVEVVSGKKLDEFFQERIFRPLDMKDTGFYVTKERLARFAANHGPKPDGGLRVIDAPKDSRYLSKPSLLSGGGGLVSTARDYLRFCQMLLNEGELDGQRLLRAETVEAMARNQLPERAYPIELGGKRPGVGFGLGFSVRVEKPDSNPKARVGEYGWGGAASTHFWISPNDDLAVVVLTQLMPYSSQMEDAVKPLVYDAIIEKRTDDTTEPSHPKTTASPKNESADPAEPAKLKTGRVLKRTYDFKEAGQEMEYALYVPKSYDGTKRYPLIVALHGLFSNPRQILGYPGFTRHAEEHGYILVAPMGYNNRGWYGSRGTGGGRFGEPENLGELSEKDVMNVLALARKQFKIDDARIYLLGHSMGGGGALHLAMEHPEIWAAIAPIAPAVPRSAEGLERAKDIPAIVVQGDRDSLVRGTRKWVEKMKALGMKHQYIEVKGGGHILVAFGHFDEIFKFFNTHTRAHRKPATDAKSAP